MKALPLIIAPNPILKQVSKPVDTIDNALRNFVKDMVQTMYSEQGVGLAAVQVGVLKRILVIDTEYKTEEDDHHHHHHGDSCGHNHTRIIDANPRCFINPEIIEFSKECSGYNEGCLSFPGARSEVKRPKEVTVKYLDLNGQEKSERMVGLLATCIQHEVDHLNGVTFVDHISNVKREMILKKLKKNQN